MILPKKDKDGIPYVSYSQLALFKRSPEEYKARYIDGEPFEGNIWTDFGQKVGEALETGDFAYFSLSEQNTLSSVTRLDDFEVEIRLEYNDFYVKGYIDTTDYNTIIDYKTGGKNKELQYSDENYWQCQIYALALQQEGIEVTDSWVEFIRRVGNPYRYQPLRVGNEVIKIPQDVSKPTLERVYEQIPKVVTDISTYYKKHL
jgi:hypothetical protein